MYGMKLFDLIVTVNTGLIGGATLIGLVSSPFFYSGQVSTEIQASQVAPHLETSAVVAGAYTLNKPTPTPTPTPPPRIVTDPVHIDIPNLSISTDITPVGLTAQNVMEVPADTTKIGWFTGSPKPGESAPRASILTGHFDTTSGTPAIFYQLETIEFGDEIQIRSSDGTLFSFTVMDVVSHPLEDFPQEIVYGETQGTYIKLITCDGIWNATTHSYSQRLVVTARLDHVIDSGHIVDTSEALEQ